MDTQTDKLNTELEQEALDAQLKNKNKEIKTLQSKNKVLEDRYVKIFRENKNLTKDREELEKCLLYIFNKDRELFKVGEAGTYSSEILIGLWNELDDEKLRLFNETLESYKIRQSGLEGKILLLERQVEQMTAQKKSSHQEIANEKLCKEIQELNMIIDEKNKEIERLGEFENEVDTLKAEILLKELQIKGFGEEYSLKNRIKENERKNELLKLRHELDEAYERIGVLEAEKTTSCKVSTNTQEIQTEMFIEASEPSMPELSDGSPKNVESRLSYDSDRDTGDFGSVDGQVNQEYLKNVIIKLFCYIEGGNDKEMRTLMHAISVILKMTPKEKEKIEESKRESTWLNPFGFFKGK